MFRMRLVALIALVAASDAGAQPVPVAVPRDGLSVVRTRPAANSSARPGTAISLAFDRAVLRGSIHPGTFRVFGKSTGTADGAFVFSADRRRVTFAPSRPFAAGETVWVHLSRFVVAEDLSPLRPRGYAFQFGVEVSPSSGSFFEIAVLSNNRGEQTRIYGAAAADLDNDAYPDLTTVNEVSADLRVFMNRGDGTGAYSDYLSPTPIGVEASPNDAADFDNDGNTDLCVAASSSDSAWIVLGRGDGSFRSVQEIAVGDDPHGIVAIDADGDGDMDVVNANNGSDDLSLMTNGGAGGFGPAAFFEGGVTGEYGLAAGDMDGDGITDLVVAGRDGSHVSVALGNGDGAFAPAGPPRATGGRTWVVALGDVNGDGQLDASTANSGDGNGSILLGNGDGTLGAAAITGLGAFAVSTDLCDLEGDGDLDWILSSFGGGFWRFFRNDGTGTFSFWRQIDAPSNPSCAVPLDFDRDGDLDLALTDEIADVVVLMRNE